VKHEITIKRAYEDAKATDGFRVLVDRLWPRGVSKERLHVKLWAKDIAPSTKLRTWFAHDPDRWTEFRKRYEKELATPDAQIALHATIDAAKATKTITLIYAARDTEHNEAVVLRDVLQRLADREG
jgi:uncharacterized protein YeaO (DUF488 family)